MKMLLESLHKYLADISRGKVRLVQNRRAAKRLPVFAGRLYDVYDAILFGKQYSLLILKGEEPPSPAQAEKHVQIARRALNENVALVLPSLQAFERKRFAERNIPFIVPWKQTFLPMLLVDFRESPRRGPRKRAQANQPLSAPAQVVLLLYLQHPGAGEWTLAEWADRLGYSRMTLSRARHDLEAIGLCEAAGKGRSVLLRFPPDRSALWKIAKPHLQSPVRGSSHARVLEGGSLRMVEAGLSALSRMSSIAPDSVPVFAMASPNFRAAVREGKIKETFHEEEDSVLVERWRYAPGILSEGDIVDPLSLYLSLRESTDERVQQALEDMMGEGTWL